MPCFNAQTQCLYRIQLKQPVCREAKCNFSSAKAQTRHPGGLHACQGWSECFVYSYLQMHFCPHQGQRLVTEKSFVKHRGVSPALESSCSVSRSPEILSCEANFAVQAGVSHPSSVSAKWGLLYSEIITQYQILCRSISPSDFYSSLCSI